jgi:hypothetical protein
MEVPQDHQGEGTNDEVADTAEDELRWPEFDMKSTEVRQCICAVATSLNTRYGNRIASEECIAVVEIFL